MRTPALRRREAGRALVVQDVRLGLGLAHAQQAEHAAGAQAGALQQRLEAAVALEVGFQGLGF